MILKEYQKQTLAIVSNFLRELNEARQTVEQARAQFPALDIDWVEQAWKKVVPKRPYRSHKNGIGELLSCFCLKIPTGGGKTLLATRVIDLVNTHFRQSRRGLVLWIVPTKQIYRQTLKALKDKDHAYRQQLDLSSGRRTLILEKTTSFTPHDLEENLCILLLMFPSANRGMTSKEKLKLNQDNAAFDLFFPTDDDYAGHSKLLETVSNLDTLEQTTALGGRFIKASLSNTIRLQRPLIILDESHKTYKSNARKILAGFNPCLIVELSATPPEEANVLVEISGVELNKEEMIKLDLHINNKEAADWRGTLIESIRQRDQLERVARQYEAESGVYIRPICIVQVERTGDDQRLPGLVHTEDVREFLIHSNSINPEFIAVKTSDKNELEEVDDIGGLMSRDCPIRFIITQRALQEGWDCSFAYVLAILTNPMSKVGLTQLVGRILRQPFAQKTGIPLLDESYVFCHSRRGKDILSQVRTAFGEEGLKDLTGRIVSQGDPELQFRSRKIQPRPEYKTAATELVLPAFMIEDDDGWRIVRYEVDILSQLQWDEIDVAAIGERHLEEEKQSRGQAYTANLEEQKQTMTLRDSGGVQGVDYSLATSQLLEVIPNPWRAYKLVRRAFGMLLKRYPNDCVAANSVYILEQLRQIIAKEIERLSKALFLSLLEVEKIRFLIIAQELQFNRLPQELEFSGKRRANREDGAPYQRSLFEVMAEEDLNGLEHKVATYLDQQTRLFFWYRNRERKDYFVQGWRPNRIYADFIVTLQDAQADSKGAIQDVYVVETKGDHLAGSEDTNYKRSVFNLCNQHAQKMDWAKFAPTMRGRSMRFNVVNEDTWRRHLDELVFPQGHEELETRAT